MKKLFIFLMIIGLIIVYNNAVACGNNDKIHIGNVKDDNDGNQGYILINTGETEGQHNDIGHWTDITTIPELKGEKGDKGDTGPQGPAGQDGYTPIKNIDYFDGKNGIDGYTPIKGVDYFDGKDGITD